MTMHCSGLSDVEKCPEGRLFDRMFEKIFPDFDQTHCDLDGPKALKKEARLGRASKTTYGLQNASKMLGMGLYQTSALPDCASRVSTIFLRPLFILFSKTLLTKPRLLSYYVLTSKEHFELYMKEG